MKFMKLGTKADIFRTDGNITTVGTDLPSDVTLKCTGCDLRLHKFPLLCRSSKLQKMIVQARDINSDEVEIDEFPGGVESLLLCMKFCYGIGITLNPYNLVAVRAGADYLEMTEAMEKGNLVYKLEVFLNSSILRSWKDSIIVLQSCKNVMPWSEDLKIIARCVDSISSKTAIDPLKVDWSFTHTRPAAYIDHSCTDLASPQWNGIPSRRHRTVPRDWWVEDICELEIDLYWRVMVAIKAQRASEELVGEALRVYASRWLPGFSMDDSTTTGRLSAAALECETLDIAEKHRLLLETLINLLPTGKGSSCVNFLLKLLKAATILSAVPSSKLELARRIGMQLEEASLDDLLIPSLSYENDLLYDVDLVQHILEQFLMQEQSPSTSPTRLRMPPPGEIRRRTQSAENIEYMEGRRSNSASHTAKLRVAKLIDSYLAEIARDPHLPVGKFNCLAEAIPEFARPVHDGLYRGIDVYLKEHPGLSKTDRKRVCRLMDCKKLSMDACIHAAQNERLPLRVVVQVLFFEQVRTAMTGGLLLQDLPSNIRDLLPPSQLQTVDGTPSVGDASSQDEAWQTVHQDFNTLKGDLANMKKRIAEAERDRSSIQEEAGSKQQQQQQQAVKHKGGKELSLGGLTRQMWNSSNAFFLGMRSCHKLVAGPDRSPVVDDVRRTPESRSGVLTRGKKSTSKSRQQDDN